MDPETMRVLAAGLCMGMGALGPGIDCKLTFDAAAQ